MPAVITSAGTFSGLDNLNPASQGPGASVNEVLRQHRDEGEQKFQPRSLNYAGAYATDVDGMQEVMQFVGLFAAAYSIGPLVAAFRVRDILKTFLSTSDLTDSRIYTP